MINIKDKTDCCGCGACAQKCPKQCIEMVEDGKGFLYPKVDITKCVQCGLCDKVCIEQNNFEERMPMAAWAAKNVDETIRANSSSGGIFTLLAEKIIDRGGVVFGVRFDDNWECTHDYVEKKEDVKAFRGSKYLPSKVGDCFKQVESFLKQNRIVLFTGTPCQIAALHKFLQKDYDNLLTVDVVCHGVPSLAVWRKYKKYITKKYARKGENSVSISSLSPTSEGDTTSSYKETKICGINFRSKKLGWKKFGFDFTLAKAEGRRQKNSVSISLPAETNSFMRLFIYNVILRPSCYKCPAKAGKTKSDITIADFWHINEVMPEYNDDKGVTLLYLNTVRGATLFDSIQCDKKTLSVEEATNKKFAWSKSFAKNPFRYFYFKTYKLFDFDFLANMVTNYRNVKVLLKIKKSLHI